MTAASFVQWAAPLVERAEMAKVLRNRWEREVAGKTGRRLPPRGGAARP